MRIQENVSLKNLGNYRIGGAARYFLDAGNTEEISGGLDFAHKNGVKFFVLGAGTNVLFDDAGFDGLILKPNINFLDKKDTVILAGAGVLMSELLDFAAENGLSDLEWAGGLPGTLGGAIYGNAGAFGGEIKDGVISVQSINVTTGKILERNGADCHFSYRNSVFKESGGAEIILSAALRFRKDDPGTIRESISQKIRYRKERHPLEHPNIGSTFKNVPVESMPAGIHSALAHFIKTDPFPVIPTAALLSEAGLKGVSCGGAMFSPKHPNFIVNVLNASSADVENLIALAKEEIKNKFGAVLEEEIRRAG